VSVTEVQSRISQIQSQLALLAPPTVSAGSGSQFAAALALQSAATAKTGGATALSGLSAQRTGSTGTTGDQVVAEAKKYLGIPYLWGGTDPKRGLDCSGLVQLVYKNVGYDLPRVSYQQATSGTAVKGGLANAQPGDVLAFGSPVHHVAIYVGDGKMIEAPRTGLDVRITDVYETPTAVRRILPAGAAGSTAQVAALNSTSALRAGTPYADLFRKAESDYGVSARLLASVAQQESGFNPSAVSSAGARGLMQLMPATAKGLGVSNAMDPAQAIDGAARLLRDLKAEFGRTDLALAAYNAGPGAVHRYGGIPPYPETQNYVRSVLAIFEKQGVLT
jgi:cell wall-associated NlpC family hydrolase